MNKILKKFLQQKRTVLLLFSVLIMLTNACKKVTPEAVKAPEPIPVVYAYEVNCDYCTISYTDASQQMKTVKNNIGKWTHTIETKNLLELKLTITTTLSGYQSIQAYIIKDGEVVYGNLGYNRADISYHMSTAQGTSTFGKYISTVPAAGSGSGGGTTTPSSSLCGARNKTGGYCKRVVAGGGRCWQHQ